MKRILLVLMCSVMLLCLAACKLDAAALQEQLMKDYADFQENLEKSEVVTVNPRVMILSDGKKALVTDIKNNTANQEAVSEMEVTFAAWDVEGKPLPLKTAENPNNPTNTLKGFANDTTVPGGKTWTANRGLILQAECKHVAYVTAIVYSCKIGEVLWENPNYDAWQEIYSELQLESWMMADMVNYLDGDTSSEEATAGETQAKFSFEDFYQNMLFQDFVAINATANLQEDGRNALMTNIRNASRTPISDITVAFAMWDENGKPLLIQSASGQSKASYVKEVSMGELVIKGAKIWEADMGLVIANERQTISHVEAIVVCCEWKGARWNNPLYDTWYTYFAGKQLDGAMKTTLAGFEKTIK